MPQYSQKIIELLRVDYPDLSAWTIICANDRAVDPVQHYIHSRLGGIMPRVESVDAYITEKISGKLKLHPVAGDEQLLLFIEFLAQRFPDEPYPARRAAHLLPLLLKLAEYNIGRKTIFGTERFTEDEWNRLEDYLETAQAFRKWLSRKNLFMTELELSLLESVTPAEKEVFIGLPAMTPVTERFYRKISRERLFIDPPLFGADLFALETLPFDSAKNLVLSFRGEIKSGDGNNIELVSLEGLHALADLVTLEVSSFLDERSENEQLIIYLLDESLTPMLWNRALRHFGNAVNLAVWLPFATTAAARRLLAEIEKAKNSGHAPDFKKFAAACAMELAKNAEIYVREECEALEAAISFSTILDEWKDRLGRNLSDAAEILIQAKKFRVTGSRSAPVQVVGFGHVSGERFSRGLILSLDSGVMPSQPYEGPFINPVHVPQLRKTVFEYEDLVFRQILAQGDSIKIVAVNDVIRERTPSYYMSLLAQEFAKTVKAKAFKESLPATKTAEKPAIKIDDDLRNKLKDFTYSYSSLSKILACPFLFYHQYILKIKPPSFMDDEEKINMRMGEFVHDFLRQMTSSKDKFDAWEKLFDKLWESKGNAAIRNIPGIDIYMLNAKIFLREIYEDEKGAGERVVFADNTLASEKEFHGTIAGEYKITGRVDRLASIDGRTEIIDFKYTKKQGKYELSARTTVRERFKEKGVLHPAAQLIIYQYFNKAQAARFYFLKEPTQERQIQLLENESEEAQDLMVAIKERLDEIVGGDELLPAHDCGECEYCQYQALCGREDYYKAMRRNS
ncbi:MAG: PD-(D/E)XK nuclease family protein [Syntrophaceae bacterium]|nr:PD-(D/E)XK nuclease family protein [Syntrophaceae bacterium]